MSLISDFCDHFGEELETQVMIPLATLSISINEARIRLTLLSAKAHSETQNRIYRGIIKARTAEMHLNVLLMATKPEPRRIIRVLRRIERILENPIRIILFFCMARQFLPQANRKQVLKMVGRMAQRFPKYWHPYAWENGENFRQIAKQLNWRGKIYSPIPNNVFDPNEFKVDVLASRKWAPELTQ